MTAHLDPGSFRDPRGRVYVSEEKVFRTVASAAAADFEHFESSGLSEKLIEKGWLLEYSVIDKTVLGSIGAAAHAVLAAPKLPFISYPYEWSFAQLKEAAVLHLDIQLLALEHGVALSDATAYNIQHSGTKLTFIDHLSFRRYTPGEFWLGHRQFCEQFLNPLLLTSLTGAPFQPWYRGAMEGIRAMDLAPLIPFRRKLSKRMLMHVVIPAAGNKAASADSTSALSKSMSAQGFPKESFRKMLTELRGWIVELQPKGVKQTEWSDYERMHNYADDELAAKDQFVSRFVEHVNPKVLWDIGCNTGHYSAVALSSGAKFVTGMEADLGALDRAYQRAKADSLAFLPIYLDATNPSPSQGWGEAERKGIRERGPADALIALAVIHHLAIGRNVPLELVVSWLTGLARRGVIEFVPKNDSKVKQMLTLREDIFPDYNEEHFLECLIEKARIIETKKVSSSGRILVWYEVL